MHREGYDGSQMLLLQPNAFKRLIDLFKHRDKRKTGTISMRELHSGLEAVGVLDSKLSDTVLYEIFSLCTMDFTGEIAYREFVVKEKAIKPSSYSGPNLVYSRATM